MTGPRGLGRVPGSRQGIALLREVAEGVTFIDTADVHGPTPTRNSSAGPSTRTRTGSSFPSEGGFVWGGPELTDRSAVSKGSPGTTSAALLKESLAAGRISLTPDEVEAITALAPEGD